MILDGRVHELDRMGNNFADQAADYGRRGVDAAVTGCKEKYCSCLKALVPDLSVTCIGTLLLYLGQWLTGLAEETLLLILWSGVLVLLQTVVVEAGRDLVMLHGSESLWVLGRAGLLLTLLQLLWRVDRPRLEHWSNWLLLLVAYIGPAEVCDLRFGGISCVELLSLYERWTGEWQRLDTSIPKYCRRGRPISVSASILRG